MRKWAILAGAVIAAASPCGATSIAIGKETGYPGERVSVPVNISPLEAYSGIDMTIEYDDSFIDFADFSLSADAKDNGAEIDDTVESGNRVDIEASAPASGGAVDLGRFGSLEFDISDSAPVGGRADIEIVGTATVDLIGGSSTNTAGNDDGSITVIRNPDEPPTGPRPTLDLRMRSSDVLTEGENPIVRFEITVRGGDGEEWRGWPADAYLGVALPDGRFFYVDRHIRLTTRRTPIRSDLAIDDLKGDVGFDPLPAPDVAPLGTYTFYGVLTFVDKNPLRANDENRITNVDSTDFDVVPLPTPTPTATP